MARRSRAPVVVGVLSALCFGLLIVALVLFTGGSGETNGQQRSGSGSTRYTPEELQDLARPVPRMRMTQEQLDQMNRNDAKELKDWIDPNSDWNKQLERESAEYRASKDREDREEEARQREAMEEWARSKNNPMREVPRNKPGF